MALSYQRDYISEMDRFRKRTLAISSRSKYANFRVFLVFSFSFSNSVFILVTVLSKWAWSSSNLFLCSWSSEFYQFFFNQNRHEIWVNKMTLNFWNQNTNIYNTHHSVFVLKVEYVDFWLFLEYFSFFASFWQFLVDFEATAALLRYSSHWLAYCFVANTHSGT